MAQTFDIRFDRAAGLAGFFEAAGNSFGWKGHGRLSIDAQGMSIAVKRGLRSLLARHRSQRIPADCIREVYREGDALRVEFATGENSRVTVPFWASDRETAAQIVQLLPTSRTVEVEGEPPVPRNRETRRLPLMMAAAVALMVIAGTLFMNDQRPVTGRSADVEVPTMMELPSTVDARPLDGDDAPPADLVPGAEAAALPAGALEPVDRSGAPTPIAERATSGTDRSRFTTAEEARHLAMLAEDPVDWMSPPPSSRAALMESAAREARMARLGSAAEGEAEAFVPVEIPEIRVPEVVIPISQTTLAHGSARDLLKVFELAAAELTRGYLDERERLDRGALNKEAFASRVESYSIRWLDLGERVLQDRKYGAPELTGLRATLMSVVFYQRAFLGGYATGLRTGNQARIDGAFENRARADEALARARQYLD
jgi:hypothetical protein